jgi:hypothetical protein
VLLSRDISIPSRKVLKSPPLHRLAPSGWLTPELAGSKATLARELLKGGHNPVPRLQRQSGIRIR